MDFVFLKVGLMEAIFDSNTRRVTKLLTEKEPYVDSETIAMLLIASIQKENMDMLHAVTEHETLKHICDDITNLDLQLQISHVFQECYDYILKHCPEHPNGFHIHNKIKECIYDVGSRYLEKEEEEGEDDRDSVS